MCPISIRDCVPVLAVLTLAGCATNKDEVLPHGPVTMLDVWTQNTGGAVDARGTHRQLLEARETLRRPLREVEVEQERHRSLSYTRSAQNEIEIQFQRLPNPDLVMYVFPHLSGTEAVPIPGYSTVLPLHQRVQYAMPGERTEDY